MKDKIYEKTVARVGIITICWNICLSLAKIVIGLFAKTSSLISDGVHSASDVFTTIVVMIGAKLGCKAPDKEHPFGHERLESIANILLAVLLFVTACSIGFSGILKIKDFANGAEVASTGSVTILALCCAVASIVIKGWMYFYTIKVANKINSSGLKADAYHHLSDSLSSFGSVLGVVGLMIGGYWSIMDPIASIIISLFVIKVSFDIAKDAVDQVIDRSAPQDLEKDINEIVAQDTRILSLDTCKTRRFGNKYYVEVEIGVPANLTVKQGHEIAQDLHDNIEDNCERIKHCMVHVNPIDEKHID